MDLYIVQCLCLMLQKYYCAVSIHISLTDKDLMKGYNIFNRICVAAPIRTSCALYILTFKETQQFFQVYTAQISGKSLVMPFSYCHLDLTVTINCSVHNYRVSKLIRASLQMKEKGQKERLLGMFKQNLV